MNDQDAQQYTLAEFREVIASLTQRAEAAEVDLKQLKELVMPIYYSAHAARVINGKHGVGVIHDDDPDDAYAEIRIGVSALRGIVKWIWDRRVPHPLIDKPIEGQQ